MKVGYIVRDTETNKFGWIMSIEENFYRTNMAGVFQDRVYVRWFKGAPYSSSPEYNTSYEPSSCLEVVSGS